MEQWIKSEPPQAETQPGGGEKTVFRAAGRKGDRKREEDQVSPVLTVQMVFCLLVVLFVLLTRSLSPETFEKLGQAYQKMLTEGISLTSSGELFRFAGLRVDDLREQLREVLARLEGDKKTEEGEQGSGGQEGDASTGTAAQAGQEESELLGQGGEYEITHAAYLKTVTLADYTLSDRPHLPVEGTLTSPFGYRVHPITGNTDFHTGVDLAAPMGTKIGAAWAGVVAETGADSVNGNYVKVIHSGTVCTSYNHLSRIDVSVGQRLSRGQTLGLVGSTGVSTGPHLHFELLIDGVRVDPAKALGL